MSRKPIMAGNWKMNLDVDQACTLASAIRDKCGRFRDVDVVIAPPAVALWPIARRVEGSNIGVAAQNCHFAEKGAYTGELSPGQIKSAGCTYVILGHSERRQYFGETDEGIAQKARSAHDHGLTPIICVGETLEMREAGRANEVIDRQIRLALAPLTATEMSHSVIAYEPVWAIGTGKTATPVQAQDIHAMIRGLLSELYDQAVANAVRIQYGGSVKPANVKDLMRQPDIDGALVGGASLTSDSFFEIVAYREEDR